MRRFALWVALAAVVILGGCREEGTVEKAGRKIDEAVEELTHPGEGPFEELGRKADEALEDAKRTVEEATERD